MLAARSKVVAGRRMTGFNDNEQVVQPDAEAGGATWVQDAAVVVDGNHVISPHPRDSVALSAAIVEAFAWQLTAGMLAFRDIRRAAFLAPPSNLTKNSLAAISRQRAQPENRVTSFEVKAIGRVASSLTDLESAPTKPTKAPPEAWLVFEPEILEGLRNIQCGDEIIIITWLDRARRDVLSVQPRGGSLQGA
jgi:hypothetical protein